MNAPTNACVLVVDDDVEIREALEEAIEAAGYPVRTASNGAEAKRMLEKMRPCAIVLDLWMPVMDGNQLFAALKADPLLASIPVVISTSVPRDAPLGVLVLPKPIDIHALLSWIERYCHASGAEPASSS